MMNEEIIKSVKDKDFHEFSKLLESRLNEKLSEGIALIEEILQHNLIEGVARRITRVNFRGQRTKKLKCPPGYILRNGSCKPMTSQERADKKRSIRKAIKTKRADATGRKVAIAKRKLAIKKRKRQGL